MGARRTKRIVFMAHVAHSSSTPIAHPRLKRGTRKSGQGKEWVRNRCLLCLLNRDVTITESDAAIMLEESAVKAIGDMLVRKKRQGDQGDNDDTAQQPTSKQRRHNKACDTTRGATIVDAMRGTCRQNIQETEAYKKKQVSKLKAEKKSNEIIFTMVSKRKEQCEEA
jgi:hypothetical protein